MPKCSVRLIKTVKPNQVIYQDGVIKIEALHSLLVQTETIKFLSLQSNSNHDNLLTPEQFCDLNRSLRYNTSVWSLNLCHQQGFDDRAMIALLEALITNPQTKLRYIYACDCPLTDRVIQFLLHNLKMLPTLRLVITDLHTPATQQLKKHLEKRIKSTPLTDLAPTGQPTILPGLDAISSAILRRLSAWQTTDAMPTLPAIPSFSRYAYEASQNTDKHAWFITTLLSSMKGLVILFALIKQGFNLVDAKTDYAGIIHQIHMAGSAIMPIAADNIPDYFENLALELYQTLENTLYVRKPHLLFHACFLLVFMYNHYLKAYPLAQSLLEGMWDTIISLLSKNNIAWAATLYPLIRAGGFSIFNRETASHLTCISPRDPVVARSIFLFFLEAYILESDQNEMGYYGIAARAAKAALAADFQWEIETIRGTILHYCQQARISNPALACLDQAALITAITHAFIQMTGIIATRLDYTAFLETLGALSKTILSCYRAGVSSFDSHLNYNQGIVVWLDPDADADADADADEFEEPFQKTAENIRRCFHTRVFADKFLTFLNAKIKAKGADLPTDVDDYHQNATKLFDIIYPDEPAFQRWLTLPQSRQKHHKILHEVLLELENLYGYNMPDESAFERVPYFSGFIPKEAANQYITDAHLIFQESPRATSTITHGRESHRIQLAGLFYLIDQGEIPLPEGKTRHDLLDWIIHENHWIPFFDHAQTDFGSPSYVMSYIRHASHLPALQWSAYCSFFDVMKNVLKTLASQSTHSFNYTRLIMAQASLDNIFDSLYKNDAAAIVWLDEKPYEKTHYPNHGVCFFKNKKPGTASDLPKQALSV